MGRSRMAWRDGTRFSQTEQYLTALRVHSGAQIRPGRGVARFTLDLARRKDLQWSPARSGPLVLQV